jgi:hypothetical protein
MIKVQAIYLYLIALFCDKNDFLYYYVHPDLL